LKKLKNDLQKTKMTKYLLILVFIFGCNSMSYAQYDYPPFNPGYGYIMVGTTKSMTDDSKIWELCKADNDTIGIVCFTVDEYKSWYTCDCKTLDSTWAAVRKRYREDIPWRDSLNKVLNADLDRMEKNFKSEKQ
jgi:hypothetical protein